MEETPYEPEILIVDNDEMAVQAMRLRFEQAGYRCTTAHSGAQALAAFNPAYTSLVVTDLNMPNGTGIDLIQSLQLVGDTPIIVVSGFTDAYAQGLKRAPNVTVLQKPFEASALLELAELELLRTGRRAA
ncbi:response regulator [Phycisphaeraceae bacterium D3-23]